MFLTTARKEPIAAPRRTSFSSRRGSVVPHRSYAPSPIKPIRFLLRGIFGEWVDNRFGPRYLRTPQRSRRRTCLRRSPHRFPYWLTYRLSFWVPPPGLAKCPLSQRRPKASSRSSTVHPRRRSRRKYGDPSQRVMKLIITFCHRRGPQLTVIVSTKIHSLKGLLCKVRLQSKPHALLIIFRTLKINYFPGLPRPPPSPESLFIESCRILSQHFLSASLNLRCTSLTHSLPVTSILAMMSGSLSSRLASNSLRASARNLECHGTPVSSHQ
mmetsp:Transcript_29356/g.70871  ORF Transcript_29356/g.70871 Transcript_29356/m.70871 type:complete len:269 (+) Transcript_29356:1471-2277(+)